MRSSRIRERWDRNEAAISGWLSIGNSYSAEIIGHSGVDAVTVDLQHGMIDIQTMIAMLQAISATPATPIVRIPELDPAAIMKALDAGAFGLICPMINSALEARDFVAASQYPPEGHRSFGPARGLLYGGADYLENANRMIVRLVMIETAAGLAAVGEICAVKGLDGIFIGPNDLGLALGRGLSPNLTDPEVLSAVDACQRAARASGRHLGLFCPNGAAASRWRSAGFDFIVPGSDANILKTAVAAEVLAARS